jgi:hypothetical protein
VLRASLCSASRWLTGPTLPGWLVLRLWLVLGLMTPALGLGGWARPAAAAEQAQVAEPGLHAGPLAHGDPAERTSELPPRVEVEDSKDSSSSDDKAAAAPLGLGPSFDLDLAAAIAVHRFADARDDGPGSSHRGALHNRGPPVA